MLFPFVRACIVSLSRYAAGSQGADVEAGVSGSEFARFPAVVLFGDRLGRWMVRVLMAAARLAARGADDCIGALSRCRHTAR